MKTDFELNKKLNANLTSRFMITDLGRCIKEWKSYKSSIQL